jgi:hypothetical protein
MACPGALGLKILYLRDVYEMCSLKSGNYNPVLGQGVLEHWSIGKCNRYEFRVTGCGSKETRNAQPAMIVLPSLQYSNTPMSTMKIKQLLLLKKEGKSL